MNKFEKVNRTDEGIIPHRSTKYSAGYDFYACEDIFIPSLLQAFRKLDDDTTPYLLEQVAGQIKSHPYVRPILIPTGIKAKLDSDCFLSLSARSSLPYKNLLIVPNAPGIIDADYYNNPDNEGEIFIQALNLSPFDIMIKKGDKLAQGIIQKYYVAEEDTTEEARVGGFGSTGG